MCDRPASLSKPEIARGELAVRLHWIMEKIDPTDDAELGSLAEVKREFFRSCIDHLFRNKSLILSAIESSSFADDRVINRGPEVAKEPY